MTRSSSPSTTARTHTTRRILLDLLDRHQTKAVFFMIGEKVRAHPELAREVIRRGHEIGNHTLTHPQASFWCAGPCADPPRDCRLPAGHRGNHRHQTPLVSGAGRASESFHPPVASDLGLQVMAWNRRGFDAVERDAGKVLARILPLHPGDIVLLHESTPIAEEVLGGVMESVSSHVVPDLSGSSAAPRPPEGGTTYKEVSGDR